MALVNGGQIPDNRENAHDEQERAVSSPSSRRIVLLGKTGVGKSATGNAILGQREFNSEMKMNAVTCESSAKHATVSGRSVSVVDTPGFFDTQMKPEELAKEIARSVYISSPGPHAFIIVFPVNMRFTDQEQQIPQMIEMMFGEEVLKYSIILFTHGDLLKGKPIEKLIEDSCRLIDLVGQCGGRIHVFNNEDVNNREQVNDLLQKIDTMIEQNGGGHYSNQMFEDAERLRREEEEERRQREEEERKEQKQKQDEFERMTKEFERRKRFEAFYTTNECFFMAAAVGVLAAAGVLLAAPVAAAGVVTAGAAGAAVVASKVVAVVAVVGAGSGAAVEAIVGLNAGADGTQRNQRKKHKYKSSKKQQ